MRPAKIIVALTAALLLLSFSITIACDGKDDTAKVECVKAVNKAAATTAADMAPDTGSDDTAGVSQSFSTIKASVRAGTNLTKALIRVAGQMAVAMARTAYATVSALS